MEICTYSEKNIYFIKKMHFHVELIFLFYSDIHASVTTPFLWKIPNHRKNLKIKGKYRKSSVKSEKVKKS